MENKASTRHAPGERRPDEDVRLEHARLSSHSCSSYFDFFPLPLIAINPHRQIVFSNKAFLGSLGVDGFDDFLAKRPGEAMGCVYASEGPNGCGTSHHCRECGALRAVMESMLGKAPVTHDCQLLLQNGAGVGAMDLRVFVAPWETAGGVYYVVTFLDVGDEKRRRVLERIFFHDILNAAGGAQGLMDLAAEEIPGDARGTVDLARASLFGLVEQINSQKELLAVENKEYAASPITLQGLEIITSLVAEFRAHPQAMEKTIRIDADSVNVPVLADYALLRRALVNMLVNALEATPRGGTVALGLTREGDKAVFRVANSAAIPESVQLQIFKRSFSTKGKNRGLGTYSIKLLTENYLGGEVGFTSNESDGAVFWLKLKENPGEACPPLASSRP